MRNERNQVGFTLLELIVALGLGAIITLTLYTLTSGSGRIFHEQQRVAHTQLALRNAVERVRADVARAGFLATPHSTFDSQVCPQGFAANCPNPPFQGFALSNQDGGSFVHLPGTNTQPRPDRIDLFGAFDDSNVYFSQTVDNGTITLDPNTVSFQQRFASAPAATRPDLINETFDPAGGSAVVRIHCPGDPVVFQAITGAAWTAPTITINYDQLRTVDQYQPTSMGMRCEISTASYVRYAIRNVCGAFPGTCRNGGEPEKSDLVRINLNPANLAELPGTTRIVAEYAVDFDVRVDIDRAPVPPVGTIANPVSQAVSYASSGCWGATGAASPVGRVRGVEFRLSVRTRDEDPAFPWVAPGGIAGLDPVLQRFKINAATVGAARVRSLRTKVELATFAAANIQNAVGGCVWP